MASKLECYISWKGRIRSITFAIAEFSLYRIGISRRVLHYHSNSLVPSYDHNVSGLVNVIIIVFSRPSSVLVPCLSVCSSFTPIFPANQLNWTNSSCQSPHSLGRPLSKFSAIDTFPRSAIRSSI